MAKAKTTINGKALSVYGAKLVDYKVNACSYKNSYMLPPKSIVPIKLNGNVGLRKVDITLDVFGKSEGEIALAISQLTAELMNEANLVLPDGYHYYCVYSGASAPEEMAPWIWRVKFEFYGFRHGALESMEITHGMKVDIKGNFEAPVKYTIYPFGDTTIKVNGITVWNATSSVVIDGMKAKVTMGEINKFGDTDIIEFPKMKAGLNTMEVVGDATVEMEYYPIYL